MRFCVCNYSGRHMPCVSCELGSKKTSGHRSYELSLQTRPLYDNKHNASARKPRYDNKLADGTQTPTEMNAPSRCTLHLSAHGYSMSMYVYIGSLRFKVYNHSARQMTCGSCELRKPHRATTATSCVRKRANSTTARTLLRPEHPTTTPT
jgi:hypothetical protein